MEQNNNLEKVGNVGDYKPEVYKASRRGLAIVPNIGAVKLYTLKQGYCDFFDYGNKVLEYFVEEAIKKDKIMRGIGLGFSILSDGVLNISMWGGEYPSLINPSIFTYDRGASFDDAVEKNKLVRVPVSKAGAFCCWELGIVPYEAKAWRTYLFSRHSDTDKQKYLDDFFSGEVGEEERRQFAYNLRFDEVGLSTRAVNCLQSTTQGSKDWRSETLGKLEERTFWELMQIKNMGKVTANEIKRKLQEHGLNLKTSSQPHPDKL